MPDIKLQEGDRVRNIRARSTRSGEEGVVHLKRPLEYRPGLRLSVVYAESDFYFVKYDSGYIGVYLKARSSSSLELVWRKPKYEPDYYKLGLWSITKTAYRSLLSSMIYGATLKQAAAAAGCESEDPVFLGELKQFMKDRGDYKEAQWYHDEFVVDWSHLSPVEVERMMRRLVEEARTSGPILCMQPEVQVTGRRHVLKKVRRNVINGKTQDDYVRDYGHARGVTEFNSRCLGKSTGRVLEIIGYCMTHPGQAVHHDQQDHAIRETSGRRHQLNLHFRNLLEGYIKKLDLKGFTVDASKVTYNPIVTEETYVETK